MKENQQNLFDTSWDLYKKVLDAGYMFHSEFSELTDQCIESHQFQAPIQILDLGCGDGSPIMDLLFKHPVALYKAYDLSTTAIEICKEKLCHSDLNYQLVVGDMLSLIQQESQKFDLVYSSYAIHHLNDVQKKCILKEIGEKLKPHGIFIYIDVFRHEMQDLSYYRKSYAQKVSQWYILNQHEQNDVIDHVNQFDIPALSRDIIHWIENASLKLKMIYKADDVHTFYAFTPSENSLV